MMLAIAQRSNKMPLDYGSYLLSSSPPTFSTPHLYGGYSNLTGHFAAAITNFYAVPSSPKSSPTLVRKATAKQAAKLQLKPIIIKTCDGQDYDIACSSENNSNNSSSLCEPTSPRKDKKKVTFADHCGKALETIRVMQEPSDIPPRLKPEFLASIREGADATCEAPPLEIGFTQPASDYLKFREKIDRNFVSLENVILKDYSIMGTVKVKNITFEKEVSVRYTCDGWTTHQDVACAYVPTSEYGKKNVFDTFSFQFTVPTTLDSAARIQFSICYKANDCEHWDSNNGLNYTIQTADWKSYSMPNENTKVTTVTDLANVDLWSSLAAWNLVDTSSPYY